MESDDPVEPDFGVSGGSSWDDDGPALDDSSGNQLTISTQDGGVTIVATGTLSLQGNTVSIVSQGSLSISASATLSVTGTTVNIN